jgi:CRP-like cAMP-binding protein
MPNPLQLSIVTFNKGTYIIVEGKAQADVFYIIRTGKVKITKAVEIVQEDNVQGPGDFFGVVSSMSGHSHKETAQALTDVSLIAVHRDQYDLLIEKNAPVAIKIIQGFARKMRYLDSAYTQLTLKNTAKEDVTHLFNVGEHYARQNQYNLAYYAYHKFVKYCPADPNVKTAKERLAKIQLYAKAVYLDGSDAQVRQYPKNTMIFSEAEPGNELFIIQKGRVRISKIVEQKEITIAILNQSDIFGEMALLTNDARTASAISHEDATLMVVNKQNFEKMVQSQPQLITKLTTILASRIWLMYKQISNSIMEDPVGRLWDMLSIQLEKNRVAIGPSQSYTFDVGPKELLTMVGLPVKEGMVHVTKMFESTKKLKLAENRIVTSSTEEVVKQVESFRRMEQLKKSRQAGSLRKA